KLNHNSRSALDRLIKAVEQIACAAMQQDSQNQKRKVDDIQVQSSTAHYVVVEDVSQAGHAYQHGQNLAVFKAGCGAIVWLRSDHNIFQLALLDIPAVFFIRQH